MIRLDVNCCRVCLKPCKAKSIISDFELQQKFLYCTQLKVKANDGLPKFMCNKCEIRLKVAHDFRRLAIESDSSYRDFIKKVNHEFKSVSKISPTKNIDEADEIKLLREEGLDYDDEDEDIANAANTSGKDETIIPDEPGMSETEEQEDEERVFTDIVDVEEVDEQQYLDSDIVHFYADADSVSGAENDGDRTENSEDYRCDEGSITMSEVKKEVDDMEEEYVIEMPIKEQQQKKKPTGQRVRRTDPLKKDTSNEFHCSTCNKNFSTKTNLTRHMLTHDDIRPYQCTVCGKGFTQNGSLKQHMLLHTGEKPHQCKECGRCFTQSKSLVFHMRRHTGEKPFECEICQLAFRQKDGLKRHNQAKHADPESTEAHSCTICNRILNSKHYLQLHMKRHNKAPDYVKCNECDKLFISKRSLDSHMKIHDADNVAYVCAVCDKVFGTRKALDHHEKTHNVHLKMEVEQLKESLENSMDEIIFSAGE